MITNALPKLSPSQNALDQVLLYENILAPLCIVLLCGIVTCVLLLWRRNVRYKQLSALKYESIQTEYRLRAQLEQAMNKCKQLEDKLSSLAVDKEPEQTNEIKEFDNDSDRAKYANSSLSNEKQQQLFLELESLMHDKLVFSDSLLSIDKLAQLLGTNRTYLSQVINEMTHESYSSYVNKFRVEYATILLSQKDNKNTLIQIAQKAGFNSASSFYTIFKKAVGVSPKIYRENVLNME